MAADNVIHISAANWQTEVMQSAVPVLVDFWAEWCVPCKRIAPILDELATELKGKVKVCKVDIDKNQELAANFHIRSIPTLLVFKGGAVQEQMGPTGKAELKTKLGAYL